MTMLSARMCDYPTITQGKTRIPGINDGEDFEMTDVSLDLMKSFVQKIKNFNLREFSQSV